MDISGLVSYDSGRGAMSTAATSRGMMMPHLDVGMTAFSHGSMDSYGYQTHGYNYHHMQSGSSYHHMVPTSYYPQGAVPQHSPHQSSPQSYHSPPTPSHSLPQVREALNTVSSASVSPTIKHEDTGDYQSYHGQYKHTRTTSPVDSKASASTTSGNESKFSTGIDNLMKAIQSKGHSTVQQSLPTSGHATTSPISGQVHSFEAFTSPIESQYVDQVAVEQSNKKRHACDIPGCGKAFCQRTHLDIHIRSHTGAKPFECKEQGCGQRFSQLGNLKTHERRHTGEKPYSCEKCHKRFAQRGNVRAHRIVHDKAKPFICKLDDCHKQFTQLGNLKSHQNKFHAAVLDGLTSRFANIQKGEVVSMADKDLWEYFANLYKNSNKGIKGRGKDRKISTSTTSSAPASVVDQTRDRNTPDEEEEEEEEPVDEMYTEPRREYNTPMTISALAVHRNPYTVYSQGSSHPHPLERREEYGFPERKMY